MVERSSASFVLSIDLPTPFLFSLWVDVASPLAFSPLYMRKRVQSKVGPSLPGIVSDLLGRIAGLLLGGILLLDNILAHGQTRGGDHSGHEIATPYPSSTDGCAYHGFLLAWAKSECVPKGCVMQVRVLIVPHAPAGRLGPSLCDTTHETLAGGESPPARRADSTLDGVVDGFQGGGGERGGGRLQIRLIQSP